MLILLQIAQLVETQKWPGLAIQNSIGAHGRGVVATDNFLVGDILLDYHGKQISLAEDAAIMAEEDDGEKDRSCYLFKVIFVSFVFSLFPLDYIVHLTLFIYNIFFKLGYFKVKRLNMSICSFEEFCSCHPRMRTMGRLLNWAQHGSNEANVKVVPYDLKHLAACFDNPPKGIMFVATKGIAPLDEICYDYGDDTCKELFGKRKNHSKENHSSKKNQKPEKASPASPEPHQAASHELPLNNSTFNIHFNTSSLNPVNNMSLSFSDDDALPDIYLPNINDIFRVLDSVEL